MKECCTKLQPYAPVFLRLALGVVFIYHGYGKVFGEGAAMGSAWNSGGMPPVVQVLVAWGELLCGAGALLGLLTPLASLGIVIIMAGAIVLVHGKNGFGLMNHGFEYNFVLILAALALLATGPGPWALDNKCCCKK